MRGETISHYKILEKLGEGGMGVVYKARDTKLDRIVAIKFLPPHMSADKEARKRFVQEAKSASAIDHQHIGTIYEIDETGDGRTFIVMAYYEGGTLREKIDGGSMTTDEVVEIASQIASGLARAHEKGIVHRDIKPQNILMTRDGEAKIIDFGLAKLAGRTRLTREGTTLGTAAYMSPEQARGEEVDHRSDIFSLGTIMYEMLVGEPPFKGEHEAALLYGIVHEEPEPVTERCKDLSAQLCAVVEMALKKDVDERYQSASEVKADLKDVFVAGKETASRSKASMKDGKRGGKGRWMGIAAAVVIVAAVIFLIKTGREPAPLTASEMLLAVVDFRDMAVEPDPASSAVLTELLNTALVETLPVRVQSPEYLREIQRRLFGSADIIIETGQELEIARKSKATYVLTGRIVRIDNERTITWRLIDVGSGESIGAGRAEPGRISEMVDDIVAGVLPQVAVISGINLPDSQVPVERITTASTTAYEHYISGKIKRFQFEWEGAVEEIGRAIEIDSSFALAYLEMARLYFGSTTLNPDIDKARYYAGEAWKYESRLGIKDRMHLQAFQYGLDYKAVRELDTLREMLKKWPDDREVITILANKSFWWVDFRETVRVSKIGMNLYPEDYGIGGPVYAAALHVLGRSEEALRASKSYTVRFLDWANAWDRLGYSYLAMGYPDSAETVCQKAIMMDPEMDVSGLAYCAYYSGNLEKSILIFKDYLSRKDISQDARVSAMMLFVHRINLPALYYEAGRYVDAERTMDEARKYVREDLSHWQLQAGFMFVSIGQAQRALEMALEMEKSDEIRVRIFALRFKGNAQVALGDLAGARSTAAKARELAEEIGNILCYTAYRIEVEISLAEGDAVAALKSLEAMREISNEIYSMYGVQYGSLLADAYKIAGELKKATAAHKETLRIYGGHALSHYELGRLYEEMGRPDEARGHYEKFLKMWRNADEGLSQPEHARARLAALKG